MLKVLLTGIQPLLKFSSLNNRKCKFIEIDNIVTKSIHNTRGSEQNLILPKVRSNTAIKAFNLHLIDRNSEGLKIF